jgi:hypothetical protein
VINGDGNIVWRTSSLAGTTRFDVIESPPIGQSADRSGRSRRCANKSNGSLPTTAASAAHPSPTMSSHDPDAHSTACLVDWRRHRTSNNCSLQTRRTSSVVRCPRFAPTSKSVWRTQNERLEQLTRSLCASTTLERSGDGTATCDLVAIVRTIVTSAGGEIHINDHHGPTRFVTTFPIID